MLTPQDPQILPASVYPLPAASWLVPCLQTHLGVFLPWGSFVGDTLLSLKLATCLNVIWLLSLVSQASPAFSWVSPTPAPPHTQVPTLDSFLPEAFPSHTITFPLPPSPPTCAPLGHPCTFQLDLTPIGGDIRQTSSSYPPQVGASRA